MTSFSQYIICETRSKQEYCGIPEVDIIETDISHEELGFLVEDALERAGEMNHQYLTDTAHHSEESPEEEEDYASFCWQLASMFIAFYKLCATTPLTSLPPPKSNYKYLGECQRFKAKAKLKRERELLGETTNDASTCPSEVESVKSHHRSNAQAHACKRQKTQQSETGTASPSPTTTPLPTITPSTSSPSPSEPKPKKQWTSQYKHSRKTEMRQSSGYVTTDCVRHRMSAKVEKIEACINIEINVATLKGAYCVKAEKLSKKMAMWTEQLREAKDKKVDPHELIKELENDPEEPYCYIKWDGIMPKVIVDSEDTVIGTLAGRPDNDPYVERCKLLYAKMAEQTKTARFTKKNLFHRHGPYPSSDMGITFGPGDKKIHHLKLQKEEACLNEELRQLGLTEHIRKFVENSIDIYVKRLFLYYKKYMDQIRAHPEYGKLRAQPGQDDPPDPLGPYGIMPGETNSWGPNVTTEPHRDVMNLGFGWCGIVPLGPFDPTWSGLFIIHNLRLIIEFPPASCILIPSAYLWHSNIPIHPEDERASITFYTPNVLYQFIDNDFTLEKDLELKNNALYKHNQFLKTIR
ncbi:hypothetical protein NP233_g10347 [Leucocoprinus birnbaumii]|uniref:Uncharacterized protein n=1 Tax=Leucocoprinus birnbaumii TaxID=56174 RepID=A0AAD5YPY3_9AGAR|nr:hypothetical protein NP233_g10347 [Leucocoprinus birnbaumii]